MTYRWLEWTDLQQDGHFIYVDGDVILAWVSEHDNGDDTVTYRIQVYQDQDLGIDIGPSTLDGIKLMIENLFKEK